MAKKFFYLLCLLIVSISLRAQIKITGRVYFGDSATHKPKAGVLVRTSAGAHAFSNDSGFYSIGMSQKDTLEFYYKGNLSASYPYAYITSLDHFDIVIDNNSGFGESTHNLGTVHVKSSNANDSATTREMYGNIFNRKKHSLSMGDNKWKESATAMGEKVPINTMDKKASLLDINSVADALNFKKKKQDKMYQHFAVQNEQLNYVQRTFTKSIVAKYSGMQEDDSLALFIEKYAPPYDKLINMSQLDLGQYIIDNTKKFRAEGKKETP